MKLLFVSPFSSAPTLLNRTLPLVRELRLLGHEIDVFVPHHNLLTSSSPEPQSNFKSSLRKRNLIVTVERRFKRFARPSFGRLFFPIAGADDLNILFQGLSGLVAQDISYDAICASKPWLRSAGLALLLRAIRKVPVILDLDDYDIIEDSYLLMHFQGMIVASHELHHLFRSYSPIYIPNSADLSTFDRNRFPPKKNETCTIVWSGTMYDYIQLENLILAFSKMKSEARLLFTGDGPKKPKLVQLARSLGLEDRIIFSEWGGRSAVPERLASADIGLVYSANTKFEACKCPGKLFEYMSMELPIVTTSVGEAAQTVRQANCGVEVPSDDPTELSFGLDYLVNHPVERRKLGENGRQFLVAKQNYSGLAARLEDYLRKILNDSC